MNAPQQMTPQQMAQMNLMQRSNLINSGLHMVKMLQPVTGALGAQLRIPLQRMGVMTGIMLEFTVPVDVTVAATQSPFGPYNLAQSVSYTDYAGILRTNTSGFQLHALNCFRGHRLMNNAAKNSGYLTATETGIDTDILALPTAVAAANIMFSLYIPCAIDPSSDLRGAVLSQTQYGDHYITIQLANALVDADTFTAPYSAGTAALQAGQQVSVTAYQHYIMPQNGVTDLPMIDLSTIYAIEGNYTDSQNIAAGQSKYINWPNNRSIMSAIHVFDNGNAGTLNGADVSKIVLLGNSNTNIRELSPRYLRNQMRYQLGTDLPSGVYYMGARSQPITTVLYGNVQSRFDITIANAGAYFVNQYESTYLGGTPLPGVTQ